MSTQFQIYNSVGKNNGLAAGRRKLEKPMEKNPINSNQENLPVAAGVEKMERTIGRVVLGEINADTRIRPSRSIKQANTVSLKPRQEIEENSEDINRDDTSAEDTSGVDLSVDTVDDLDDSNCSGWDDVPMIMDESCANAPEEEDPLYLSAPEYATDIYHYLRKLEMKNRPSWNYMPKQPEVTYKMRTILVDWLVEVSAEYKLHPETLHLTISYVDRFMSLMSVTRSKLQLVGIASMFIAAKMEEIYPPDVADFVYITDDSYTKKHVLRMEKMLLHVLNFHLSTPTSHLFVNKFCKMFGEDKKCVSLANYINDLSLLDGETFLRFPPSVLAASSLALARHTLGHEAWSHEMAGAAGYRISHLKHCLIGLYNTFKEADNHPQQAIQLKYKSSKLHKVADIPARDIM